MHKHTAFIPDVAKTDAGFFLDVEPIRVIALNDLRSLAFAIEEAISAGNRQVPTPSRDYYKKPFLINLVGVRSWRAFEKRGACFTILRDETGLEVTETGRSEDGAWVDDNSKNKRFPANSSPSDLAQHIVQRAKSRPELA